MRELLDIGTGVAGVNAFRVSLEKFQWMGFNATNQSTLQLQGKTVEACTWYRYLGVMVTNGAQFLGRAREEFTSEAKPEEGMHVEPG